MQSVHSQIQQSQWISRALLHVRRNGDEYPPSQAGVLIWQPGNPDPYPRAKGGHRGTVLERVYQRLGGADMANRR